MSVVWAIIYLSLGAGAGFWMAKKGSSFFQKRLTIAKGSGLERALPVISPYIGAFIFLVGIDFALGQFEWSPPLLFLYKSILAIITIVMIVRVRKKLRS